MTITKPESKQNKPRPFNKGQKVRNVYTGEVFIVKTCSWQEYAGGGDYTICFEPTETQPTPWDKSSNLELVQTGEKINS